MLYRLTNSELTDSNKCCGENMAFRLKMNDSCTIRGKKFDCSFAWLLDKYKLSDKFAIPEKIEVKFPGHQKFAFVAAADKNFFPSLRRLIANIKQKFGCNQKIIFYDLGGVTENGKWVNELNSICNFERHVFDFSQMVDGSVRHLQTYAWKVYLLAHVLLEYDTVVWVDSTIILDNFNLTAIFASMEEGRIGPVQMPRDTWHGTNIATHPGMYEFLPMFSNFGAKKGNKLTNDPPQFESGLLILHKSEQTRQMMKWYKIAGN
ncbi:hypothetical protein niasHT_038138 [Heterodera trifolii]|uniref:Nucleotide-diphospho-sugar transferase domain-containing protein n=1 Tax=Heterodera trifolii TaxID=157864 RepID=A0ABD2IAV5_9BILA